jgi:hypothetical protein
MALKNRFISVSKAGLDAAKASQDAAYAVPRLLMVWRGSVTVTNSDYDANSLGLLARETIAVPAGYIRQWRVTRSDIFSGAGTQAFTVRALGGLGDVTFFSISSMSGDSGWIAGLVEPATVGSGTNSPIRLFAKTLTPGATAPMKALDLWTRFVPA